MKKLPSTISSEELLKVIEDTVFTDKPIEHSVLQFLADFNIEPGKVKINSRVLYKLYYYHTEEPVSPIEFNCILLGYFESIDDSNGKRFFVNRPARDLTRKLAQFLASSKAVKKTKNPHYRKHFESFLESQGLKSGTINIPAQALFFFYDKWQYENKLKTRLNYKNFLAMIRLYFITKRTAREWCIVKINREFFDNNKESLPTALEWGKKFNVKKKNSNKRF
jgi:hypothetical protein